MMECSGCVLSELGTRHNMYSPNLGTTSTKATVSGNQLFVYGVVGLDSEWRLMIVLATQFVAVGVSLSLFLIGE
nr:hypothetical protein [cyanobacterium endosymbiont of Rhopalodia gibberula]